MATVKPFAALRYNNKIFPEPLVSPPYDIITERQRQRMALNECHMINLDKPGSDDDPDRYDKSVARLEEWKRKAILVTEDEPCFYLYTQKYAHPETKKILERSGIFAAVKLEKFYERAIYPHERTLSGPKIDRLKLMKATKSNLSPVFGLYDEQSGEVQKLLQKSKFGMPLYKVYKDFDGTEHSLWRINDRNVIQKISSLLSDQKIIIADGHHRYETALNYQKAMREHFDGAKEHSSDYVMMCLVNFNDPGLIILPTHRLFSLDVKQADLLKKLKKFFSVEECSNQEMEKRLTAKKDGERLLGLYSGNDLPGYLLSLKDETVLESIVPKSNSEQWRGLEVNLLYYVIIKHCLNMNDSDFESKISYSHSFEETFNAVDAKEVNFAFLLPPCSKADIQQVTLAHEVMPQKSTYFFPKIFSGFVIYEHTK